MTVEIPISWLGPVILTLSPAIPPIMLIAGILMIWKTEDVFDAPMGAILWVWVAIIGALGCLVEIFHYGVVRFV